MKSLKTFTTEELEKELDNRYLEANTPSPLKISAMNMTKLVEACVYHINYLAEHKYPPKDGDHYIFEAALTAVYGNDVWAWYNEVYE